MARGKGGQQVVGFCFSIQRFSTWRFLFWISIQREGKQGKADRGGLEGEGEEGTLSGVLTQQRAEQISSCIISSSICSCLQKGLSVGVDGVAVLCKSRVEQGRGQGGFVIVVVVVVVAWPLGFPASLSQALFINQIKFIWPPVAASLSPHTHTHPPSYAHSLPEWGKAEERREGGGEGAAARSRRCQLPISWAFFNILNCLAECVAPVSVPVPVPVPFPDPDPDPALGQHLSESSLPQIACRFHCLLLLLLLLLPLLFSLLSAVQRVLHLSKSNYNVMGNSMLDVLFSFPWAIYVSACVCVCVFRFEAGLCPTTSSSAAKRAHPPAKTVAAAQFELALFTLLLCCCNTLWIVLHSGRVYCWVFEICEYPVRKSSQPKRKRKKALTLQVFKMLATLSTRFNHQFQGISFCYFHYFFFGQSSTDVKLKFLLP